MKLVAVLISIAFVVGAGIFSAGVQYKSRPVSSDIIASDAPKSPEFSLSAAQAEQGDTLIFRIDGETAASAAATFDSRLVPIFRFGNALIGIIGVDAKAKSGASWPLLIKLSSGQEFRRDILVEPRDFPVVKIILPPELVKKGVTAGELAQNIKTKDRAALDAIFKIVSSEIYFREPFREPLKNWIDVGGFGVIREFRNGGIRHLGVDLKAREGEAVEAANDGVVRFSEELENFGKTVVIDHGIGIFSAYLHLSETLVQNGLAVKKGQTIGLVGSTGEYSIEPHLHFSIKIRGSSVDPRGFLDAVNQFLHQ